MAEQRQYSVSSQYSAFGRSYIYILCPFCNAEVKTYVWSLAGSGKRCPCGVKFDNAGNARKDRP